MLSTQRGYYEYTGGYHENTGGYPEYTGGCSVHGGDIMSTLGLTMMSVRATYNNNNNSFVGLQIGDNCFYYFWFLHSQDKFAANNN